MDSNNGVVRHLLTLALLVVTAQSVGEEFSIFPSDEIIDAVDNANGGHPLIKKQITEREKFHEQVADYDKKLAGLVARFEIPLDNPRLPTEIVVSKGYFTSITFMDVNGQPWPVFISKIADKGSFKASVGSSKEEKVDETDLAVAHILTLETGRLAGRSNAKIFFKGYDVAIDISLIIGVNSYHKDVTIVLPLENPDAPKRTSFVEEKVVDLPFSYDPFARKLIDGVDIDDAIKMDVEVSTIGGKIVDQPFDRAMKINGRTYLKTRLLGMAPEPIAITPGLNGYKVYTWDKEPRGVSGINRKGRRVMVKFKLPESALGFRKVIRVRAN